MPRKSTRVSANEFKVYREAITSKMTGAGFSKDEVSRFETIIDRVGKKDILDFMFLVEKVGAILPLTQDEYLEAKQDVKEEQKARRCEKCNRVKMLVNGICYNCPK